MLARAVVTVQFVGAGDAFGSDGRFQACVSLRWTQAHLLLDCGASSLIALKRLGLDPSSVDAILVSHLHGDHFGGIPFLILDQQFVRRERPLTIAGPIGLRQRLLEAMEVFFPGSSTAVRRFDIDIVELAERTPTRVGPAEVTAIEVAHPSGAAAYGLRLSCGDKLVACSGDSEWTDSLFEIAAGADVFICEAYTYERVIKYHLSYMALRQRQAQLTCRRLVLTHLGPEALAHQTKMDDVEIASDGYRIEL